MKAGARMSVLLAMMASGSIAVSEAGAWVEVAAAASVHAAVDVAYKRVAARGDGLLKKPSSFVTVRSGEAAGGTGDGGAFRISMPGVAMEGVAGSDIGTDGLVAVPANARGGDPAYATMVNEEEGEEIWYEDDPTVYGPHGMVFADGVTLGYTTLRRHGPGHDGRRQERWRRERRERVDVPEFGSDDLHRSAQLKFAEAAQPRLAEQEAGFERAQRQFHRATLTPGGKRGADGLRHERSPSSRPRLRTNW